MDSVTDYFKLVYGENPDSMEIEIKEKCITNEYFNNYKHLYKGYKYAVIDVNHYGMFFKAFNKLEEAISYSNYKKQIYYSKGYNEFFIGYIHKFEYSVKEYLDLINKSNDYHDIERMEDKITSEFFINNKSLYKDFGFAVIDITLNCMIFVPFKSLNEAKLYSFNKQCEYYDTGFNKFFVGNVYFN